jgi:hypothetical protein
MQNESHILGRCVIVCVNIEIVRGTGGDPKTKFPLSHLIVSN